MTVSIKESNPEGCARLEKVDAFNLLSLMSGSRDGAITVTEVYGGIWRAGCAARFETEVDDFGSGERTRDVGQNVREQGLASLARPAVHGAAQFHAR